jgi:HK97 family phage major capsid protein
LQDLVSLVEKEARPFNEEEKTKYDQLFARQSELDSQIDTVKRANEVKALNAVAQEEKAPVANYSAARNIEKENLAFRGWLLNQNGARQNVTSSMRQAAYDLGLSLDSSDFIFRQQSVGTDSEGGYLRTPSVYAGIERSMKSFGGIASVCTVLPSANGNPSFWATSDDTSNVGAVVNELGTLGNTAATFGKIDFNYTKIGSGVFPVSNELLVDSEVPVAQLVESMIGERLARKVNTHTTTANLTGNKGFVQESTLGKTAAAAAAITVSELIDLKHSVDKAYRDDPSTYWYMNDNTLAYLSKLVDDMGRPLLMSDYTGSNGPDRLLGKPILICNDMADIGANAKAICFGPASKFIYRPVSTVSFTVLKELYALEDAVGFTAFLRMSSRLVNTAAIKHLKLAAS